MKHHKKQDEKKTQAVKPPQSKPAAIAYSPKIPVDKTVSDKKLKRIFFISLAVMLAVIWISGYNVGFHSDEMDMNNYCKNNYKYYFSGGKDTSYRNSGVCNVVTVRGLRTDTLLRYYGSSFDYLPVGFNMMTGLDKGKGEFNSRHMFNQFFAILCVLFAGLIAFKMAGWRAAIFTQWLLFLTPVFFGHALFNTKDIPFCAGFVASLYFMALILEELPSPSWKTTLFLMLSFAFTTGIRMGGLLVVSFLFLFIAVYIITKKIPRERIMKHFVRVSLQLCVVVLGGMFLVVISWPFLLTNPLQNIPATIGVINKFPVKILLPFEGKFISSWTIPYYYLPKLMLITIPLFIIISFLISPFVIFRDKNVNWRIALLILFSSVFPVIYAVIKNVPLYSAWRHFLFVYPGIVIVAGVGLSAIMGRINKPALRMGFVSLCFAGMLHPLIWSVKNHPYEYTYFNEAEGGFKNAYNNYETDYWQITVRDAIDWLFKNEQINDSKDSVYILSNVSLFADYYISRNYPTAKVRLIDGGYKTRCYTGWNYAIFSNIFLTPEIMDADFPPAGAIHTVEIDNSPITTIIKDTARLDGYGIIHLFRLEFTQADSTFDLYLRYGDRNNIGLQGYMGISKAMKGDLRSAFDYGKRSVELDKGNYTGYLAIGLAYLFNKQRQDGVPYLAQAYLLSQGTPNEFNTNLAAFVSRLLQSIDPTLMLGVETFIRSANSSATSPNAKGTL